MASRTYIIAPQDWKPAQLPEMHLFGPPWRKNQWHTSALMSHQNSDTKSIKPCTWVALIQISHVRFMQPLPCSALSTNGNMTDFAHFHCIHLTNSFVVCNIVHCIVDHESSSSSSFFLSFVRFEKMGGFCKQKTAFFNSLHILVLTSGSNPSPECLWHPILVVLLAREAWISHTDGMPPSQFCQEELLLLAPPLLLHTQNLQINWWCQSFLSHFLPN